MLLTVDAGNTNICLSVYKGDEMLCGQNHLGFESLTLRQKKRRVSTRRFFNEIHPCGWVKSASRVKSPEAVKSGSTPGGWISFHRA